MRTLNISLSETMRQFVEDQAQRGGYISVEEYVRTLIHEALLREAKKELDAKLIDGLESGPASPMTRDDWNELKRRVWERESDDAAP